MANDFEQRLGKLETRLDQHLLVIHEFIDELRVDRDVNRQIVRHLIDMHAAQQEQTVSIVEMQGHILQLIDKMDGKLDDHNARLSSAGI